MEYATIDFVMVINILFTELCSDWLSIKCKLIEVNDKDTNGDLWETFWSIEIK